VLTEAQRHAEAEFLDPLIRAGHVAEVGGLNVQVLDASTDRVEGNRFTAAIAT